MRRLVLVATVLSCVLLWLPAVASATSRTASRIGSTLGTRGTALPRLLVTSETTLFQVRPRNVSPSASGMRVLTGLRWRDWSHSRARATGTYRELNLFPQHRHGVTVRASDVRSGRFTRLTVRFRDGHIARYRLHKTDYGYAW